MAIRDFRIACTRVKHRMQMPLTQVLFPSQPRQFPGQRWVNITLRSAHLVGIAGIGGGFLFALDPAAWNLYWRITLATGIALSLVYLWSTAAWLFEIKGLAIVVKTALLVAAVNHPDLRHDLFILIIVISALSAHAPARIRGYRWLGPRAR